MNFKSSFRINGTIISNEFIDEYMASANGEYVKEYLYLMRHEGETVTAAMIAEALNHTEADVKRALAYWNKAGVLTQEQQTLSADISPAAEAAASLEREGWGKISTEEAAKAPKQRSSYTPEQVSALAKDEDFTQLLYIAQKYMNKVFTQRECEVFAYLYDGLSMSAELLEYVVEYCVQEGHTSIRYIETVALSWHERGICTVQEAKNQASSYSRDFFAVMKAFGLNGRKPGSVEKEFMERWFRSYGFTKELVLEACNRTLTSTHEPSFPYADKILEGWKEKGVRSMEDVRRLDADRKKGAQTAQPQKNKTNQFQNFPQRNIDYDSLILQQLTGKESM